MLRATPRPPGGIVCVVRAAVPFAVVEQLGQQGGDPRPGTGDEPGVERRVRHLPAFEVLRPHVVVHLRHQPLELGEVLRREPRNGGADRHRFERDPHRIELLHIGDREVGDPDPAVRLGQDEAFVLEHPQRLTQRRAADSEPELLGQHRLGGGLSRRDLAAYDRVSEPVVHELDVLPVARTLSHVGSSAAGPALPAPR